MNSLEKSHISYRIKMLRYEKRISQAKLADIIGLSKSVTSAYEKQGKTLPKLDTIIKIAYYFNVSVDYLVGTTENRFPFDGSHIQLPLETTVEQYELIKQVAGLIIASKVPIIENSFSEFPDKLKLLRLKTKTSQKQLADTLAVCHSAISAYESGKHMPYIDALINISKYFNTSIDYLIGLSSNPNLPHDKSGKPYVLSLREGISIEKVKMIQRFAIDLVERSHTT
jgi:transcriptional regulator with XRE-family HTH domain